MAQSGHTISAHRGFATLSWRVQRSHLLQGNEIASSRCSYSETSDVGGLRRRFHECYAELGRLFAKAGDFPGPQAPVERPQAAPAATHGLRRPPQGLAGAVARLPRGPAQHFAPRDLMLRGQPQPRRECLRAGPRVPVQADLRDEGLHHAGMQAGDGDHVHPRQLIQQAAGIVGGGVLAVRVPLGVPLQRQPLVPPSGLRAWNCRSISASHSRTCAV